MRCSVLLSVSRHFTVFTYDRRGRGRSGDTAPYAVEREVEDCSDERSCRPVFELTYSHESQTKIEKITIFKSGFKRRIRRAQETVDDVKANVAGVVEAGQKAYRTARDA